MMRVTVEINGRTLCWYDIENLTGTGDMRTADYRVEHASYPYPRPNGERHAYSAVTYDAEGIERLDCCKKPVPTHKFLMDLFREMVERTPRPARDRT